MEKVLGTRYEAKPNSVGSFASNLRSFESVRDFITSATVVTLIDLPFGIIFLIVIAWINPYMVLPALIGGAVVLIYSLSVQTKMHDLSETMYRASAQRNATLIESLVGLETVKSMGVEGQMQGKWEKSALFLSEVGSKLKLLSSSITNGTYALQQIISVAIVILGVYLISNGDLTMGGLIACSQLTSRGLAPISQIAGLFTQYHTAATSLKSLDEVMGKPVERNGGGQPGGGRRADLRTGLCCPGAHAARGPGFHSPAGRARNNALPGLAWTFGGLPPGGRRALAMARR